MGLHSICDVSFTGQAGISKVFELISWLRFKRCHIDSTKSRRVDETVWNFILLKSRRCLRGQAALFLEHSALAAVRCKIMLAQHNS